MKLTPGSTSDESGMSQDNEGTHGPVVWLITDNKPGHRNQLKGLGNRLRALANARIHWLSATDYPVPLWRAVLAVAPRLDPHLPHPDLVVAAGSGTHRLLLALRRRRGVRTLVLMKPGFPLALVDGAIVPAHDRVPGSARVFVTEGALNAVTPMARLTDQPNALVLIGGPSPHFDWQEDALLNQITDLMARYPGWRWTLSDSRRTPGSTSEALAGLRSPRVTFVHHQQTHEGWLSHQLAASRAVWVTPDSMSMVCEAATSGVPTGLFELPQNPGSRVARGVARLLEQGYVARWQDHPQVMGDHPRPTARLWEADRAARWILPSLARTGRS